MSSAPVPVEGKHRSHAHEWSAGRETTPWRRWVCAGKHCLLDFYGAASAHHSHRPRELVE